MRVLISAEYFHPQTVGSAYAAYRLAKGLASRGHEVSVICSGDSLNSKNGTEDNIKVFRVSSFPIIFNRKYRFSPLVHHLVGPIFDEVKPDIVHVQDHLIIGSSVIDAALRRNIPIIGTNHFHPDNLLHYLNVSPAIEDKMRKIMWKHFNAVVRHLRIITTVSEIAKNVMRSSGVKKDITVISNGINLKNYKPRPKEEALAIAEKYGLSKTDRTVLFVGRLEKEKNIDVLIRAIKIVNEKMPAKLLIVGFGSGEDKLRALVEELDLSGSVKFLGKAPDEDVIKLYNFVDLFATASTVELQGLSVMEAMASGLPVVSSDGMALPELVKDGVNGFIFPSGNYELAARKMAEILENKELAENMGKKSLELIQKHDVQKSLDEYENIYNQAIAVKQKPKVNRSLFIISKIILDTPFVAALLFFAVGVATATATVYKNSDNIKYAYQKVKIAADKVVQEMDLDIIEK